MTPMIATASSFLDRDFGPVSQAINGVIESDYVDMFHSRSNDDFAWLAIDLGFYYKVILLFLSIMKSVTLLHLLLGHRGVNGGAEWLLC